MAVIAGYNGQVDMESIIDSDVSFRTHSWNADISCDELDSTDFTTTGWRTKVGGLKSWSATVELYTDSANHIVPSDVGSEVTVQLYINSTTGIKGKGMITGWNPATSVDGIETTSVSITGTSDLFEL